MEWDRITREQVCDMVMTQVQLLENYDVTRRWEQDQVIGIHNPEPRKQYYRRKGNQKHAEEKAFLEIMKIVPDCPERFNALYPAGLAGSSELQNQIDEIKREKRMEFSARPLDLTLKDWLQRPKPDCTQLELLHLKTKMMKISFDELLGPLGKVVKEEEVKVINSITSQLDHLIEIQKEKQCMMNGKIPKSLVNENCLPKLAQLCRNTQTKGNSTVTVKMISSDSDSFESWNGSWSTE